MSILLDLGKAFLLVALLLQVLCFGRIFCKILGFGSEVKLAVAAVILGLGITGVGLQMWLLGYFHAWSAPILLGITVVCAFYCRDIFSGDYLWKTGCSVGRVVRRIFFERSQISILLLVVILMVLTLLISCLRRSVLRDEIDYHWGAPLFWAAHHGWAPAPMRFSNGPALGELLFLYPALFGSLTAGHLVGLLFLVLLIICAAALSGLCGVSTLPACVAILGVPILATQGSVCLTDTALAALLLSGLVALLCGKRDSHGAPVFKAVFTAGWLMAGAYSIKPALAAPAIFFAALIPGVLAGSLRRFLPAAAALLSPVVLVALLWMVHTYTLLGIFWQPPPVILFLPAGQDLARHPEALAQIPDLSSLGRLLALPLVTPFWGTQEPFGGRTGYLMIVFVPLWFWQQRCLPAAERRNGILLFVLAMAYLIAMGLFTPRTRYLDFSWALLSCLSAVAFHCLYAGRSNKWAYYAALLYVLLGCLSVADSAHTLLKFPS